jgi:hypothetical protein
MERMTTASPKAGTTEMSGAHEPRQRPDPRPMRLVLGLGGLAALSALVGAVIAPPAPMTAQDVSTGVADTAATPGADALADGPGASPAATEPPVVIKHVKRYVYLAPGQAPPLTLATKLPAPTPRATAKPKTPAPPPATPKPKKRIIIVTSQSGAKP